MTRIIFAFGFLFFFLLPSIAFSTDDKYSSITVLASTSLTDVMAEIVRLYSAQENITVSITYESPEILAESIVSGETADIYISESREKFVDLQQRGLFDIYSVTKLAYNKLVLVIASNSELEKKLSKNAAVDKLLLELKDKTILVISDPSNVALGAVTKSALEKLNIWPKIESSVIRAADSRNVLYLISKGGNAGIVYFTDAYANPEVKIISELPGAADENEKIIYQGAVVAGENMPPARKFLDFLKSKEAQNIFKKHGFITG